MDNKYFDLALSEAKKAIEHDDVPIGAVVVFNGEVIAKEHNRVVENKDPLAHAEILAIKSASEKLEKSRLDKAEIYVTLEPCPMCAGAILNSRIKEVYYCQKDANAGAFGSVLNLNSYPLILKTNVTFFEYGNERELLSEFFKKKRK